MATITINNQVFTSLPAGFTGPLTRLAAGNYYAVGQFAPAPNADALTYDDRMVTFPGVDGIGIIRFGSRSQLIVATLLFAGSVAVCESGRETFYAAANQLARYTITLQGGTSFDGCRARSLRGTSWMNIDGQAICVVQAEFLKMSEDN